MDGFIHKNSYLQYKIAIDSIEINEVTIFIFKQLIQSLSNALFT